MGIVETVEKHNEETRRYVIQILKNVDRMNELIAEFERLRK